MHVNQWLAESTKRLAEVGVGTARLDSLVLLEDTLALDRSQILAEPNMKIDPKKIAKLEKLLKRRVEHEPLAYMRGRAEFYGREFVLTPAVLQPRPESETMIDMIKQLANEGTLQPAGFKNHTYSTRPLRLADVGAGSGALGITAKLELMTWFEVSVELLEIDPEALKVAQINIDKYTTDIACLQSDLLAQSTQDFDVLLCNLPYVPDKYIVNKSALYEPKIALFGGPDGLDLYQKLFRQVQNLLLQPLFILTESLPSQHKTLEKIANAHHYVLHQTDDFIQAYQHY